MYCSKCGNEIMEEAVICPKCGCATGKQLASRENVQRENKSTLSTIAKVFMILGTVIMGFYLIPLAWCIPMTISYCKKIKNGEPISTAFKVCSLLFVSLIGGILMLCDNN